MYSYINILFPSIKISKDLYRFFVNIIDMEGPGRKTHRYEFKRPDLVALRKLGKMLKSPYHFRDWYRYLLSILGTDVDDGFLNTLVQFYDLVYHCFTFPGYQLVPTLEEYSHWVGLPVLNRVPFHGLEPTTTIPALAKALHLETTDIKKTSYHQRRSPMSTLQFPLPKSQ